MRRRLATILAAMISIAGCGGRSTPTSPTTSEFVVFGNATSIPTSAQPPPPTTPPPATLPASLVGNWSGQIIDPVSGNGTVRLSLGETTPTGQPGTWSATFTTGERLSGVVAAGLGTDGYGMLLYAAELQSCGSEAAPIMISLLDVIVASNRLTAVTGRFMCSGRLTFGSVSLSKQ
jgi:hypothetical protein